MYVDLLQPRLHPLKPDCFFLQGLFDLGFAQDQHPPDFINRGVPFQKLRDLFQRQTQFFQNQDAIQPRQLLCAVS